MVQINQGPLGLITPDLAREITHRLNCGWERVTVAEMTRRFAALGYRLDRESDCYSRPRYLTGHRAGQDYPAISTGVVESDTGLRAWNVDARRDARFRAMQDLRSQVFAVVNRAILEA